MTEPAVMDAPADVGNSSGTESTPNAFPKVIAFTEDSDIVHYAPEAHERPDSDQRS